MNQPTLIRKLLVRLDLGSIPSISTFENLVTAAINAGQFLEENLVGENEIAKRVAQAETAEEVWGCFQWAQDFALSLSVSEIRQTINDCLPSGSGGCFCGGFEVEKNGTIWHVGVICVGNIFQVGEWKHVEGTNCPLCEQLKRRYGLK